MKKIGFVFVAAISIAAGAWAEMDNRDYSFSLVTTAVSTQCYTLRGTLNCVYVDMPTAKTATVAVATSEGTIFTKAGITSDTVFYPVVPLVNAADGSSATFVGGTNNVANAWNGKAVMAGLVTVTVTPASNTTGTNTFGVRLIYDR